MGVFCYCFRIAVLFFSCFMIIVMVVVVLLVFVAVVFAIVVGSVCGVVSTVVMMVTSGQKVYIFVYCCFGNNDIVTGNM